MKYRILFRAVIFLSTTTYGAELRVPSTYQTIQEAIDSALNDDTVLVASGTYTGTGNRDCDFHGKRLVVRSENGSETTLLDLQANSTDRHRAFFFHSHEDTLSCIEGFTIANGYAPYDTVSYPDSGRILSSFGGAILCADTSGVTVKNCVFARHGLVLDSITWLIGSATVECYNGSTVSLSDCTFQDNFAHDAGAIEIWINSSAAIARCTFINNRAVDTTGYGLAWGGAVAVGAHSEVLMSDCVFDSNSAGPGGANTHGGALFAYYDSYVSLRRCTFSGNTSLGTGGAILLAGSQAWLDSCSFQNNHASIRGGAVSVFKDFFADASYEFAHSVFWRNTSKYGGGFFFGDLDSGLVRSCTFVENNADSGGSAIQAVNSVLSVEQTICAFGLGSPPVACLTTFSENPSLTFGKASSRGGLKLDSWKAATTDNHVTLDAQQITSSVDIRRSCLFGNEGGDWIDCIASQSGINGNLNRNPLFCDDNVGDFSLDSVSACVPANNATHVLIGALSAGCHYCDDPDGDDICANIDNCPATSNSNQLDLDSNGVGDVCEDRAAYTEPGAGVSVAPTSSVTLTFGSVTTQGVTEVIMQNGGPPPPSGFSLVPLNEPLYFDVITTSSYTDSVQVCIYYEPAWLFFPEDLLLMVHASHENPDEWQFLNCTIDTALNLICGKVSSLSLFALAGPCCVGNRGNVNMLGSVDLSDLSLLIAYLLGFQQELPCPEEANMNGLGQIDLSDLSALITYLTGSGYQLVPCY